MNKQYGDIVVQVTVYITIIYTIFDHHVLGSNDWNVTFYQLPDSGLQVMEEHCLPPRW